MKIKSLVCGNKQYIHTLETLSPSSVEKTAILCSNDIYAFEILNYFQSKGIYIPSTFGLMGFDNIDILKYVRPSLATVAYPLDELGKISVDCIIMQINGESGIKDIYLKHTLIEGESI